MPGCVTLNEKLIWPPWRSDYLRLHPRDRLWVYYEFGAKPSRRARSSNVCACDGADRKRKRQPGATPLKATARSVMSELTRANCGGFRRAWNNACRGSVNGVASKPFSRNIVASESATGILPSTT
jgi:hypothetical protein